MSPVDISALLTRTAAPTTLCISEDFVVAIDACRHARDPPTVDNGRYRVPVVLDVGPSAVLVEGEVGLASKVANVLKTPLPNKPYGRGVAQWGDLMRITFEAPTWSGPWSERTHHTSMCMYFPEALQCEPESLQSCAPAAEICFAYMSLWSTPLFECGIF